MRDLIIEELVLGRNPSAKDLARHLYSRMFCGKAVIVADRPDELLPSLRKQWQKLTRRVQQERSRAIDAVRIGALSTFIAHMQSLQFTTAWPPDYKEANVYIVTAEQLLQWAPEYRTMYVTCKIKREQLQLITAWMSKGSLVVICELAK